MLHWETSDMQLARAGPQQSIKKTKDTSGKKNRKYVILTRIVSFVGTRCFTQWNAASDDVYAKGSLFLPCFFCTLAQRDQSLERVQAYFRRIVSLTASRQETGFMKNPFRWRLQSVYGNYLSLVPLLLANDRKKKKRKGSQFAEKVEK